MAFPHPASGETGDIRVTYPNWYRGFNGACGLNILTYTTMHTMFTALRAGTFGWDYVKPTGGIGVQPFRLLDFVGYDVEAQPPIISDKLAAKYYISNSSVGVSATVRSPGETELTLSDLGNAVNLGNCYFGAAISKVGTTTYKYITETSTITGGDPRTERNPLRFAILDCNRYRYRSTSQELTHNRIYQLLTTYN